MDLKLILLALVITFSSGDESTVKDVRPSVVITSSKIEELDPTIFNVSAIQSTEKALKTIINVSNVKESINNSTHKSEPSVTMVTPEFKHTKIEINHTNAEETTLNSSVTKPSVTTKAIQPIITTETAIPFVKKEPEPGDWKNCNTTTENQCIKIHMELQFFLTYPSVNGSVKNTTIFIPKEAQASGTCLNSTEPKENIKLQWNEGNTFEIQFAINKTSKNFGIESFHLVVDTTNFENIKQNISNMSYINNKPGFPATPLNMSYKCDRRWMRNLTTVDNYYVATLIMSHVQLEAFKNCSNDMFSEAKDCEGFDTPDIVPIVVGLVLSVLVLIVLAAYLIGRKRSQNRGYLSM